MKKHLILCTFIFFIQFGFSQLPFFMTPPNVYITESGYSGNCIQSLYSSPTSGHQVANGYWDESWVLRFYVINDSVFDRTAGFLGLLNGYETITDIHGQHSDYVPWLALNDDLVIIPKPGACKHMYIIYSIPGTVYSAGVLYTEVDISGSTPTLVGISYLPGTSPNALIDLGTFSGSYVAGTVYSPAVSLAASKPYDSNNDRILYVVGGDGNVYSVPVTSSGFGTATNIATVATGGGWTGQMKLRSDGQMLAFVESNPIFGPAVLYEQPVYASGASVGLANGSATSHTLPGPVTRVNGLEFLDGTDGNLMLSTDNGLYSFSSSGGTFTQQVSGDYKETQINYDVNGYFYLVNDAGILKKSTSAFTITDANNTGYPTCTIYSNNPGNFDGGTQQFNSIYTLPNEVDGDNYSYFTGVNKTTCNYQINGINPISSCANIQQVYTCAPITLTDLSTGAISYNLSLNSINSSCAIVSGLSYTESGISSLPTDLRLVDGSYLETHPGRYELTITANNGCGDNITVSTFINVNTTSTSPAVGLELNASGGPCFSSNSASPCILCSSNPTMNISSSTGSITYYSTDVYQYLPKFGGGFAWAHLYGSGHIALPSGVSGATSLNVGCSSADVNCITPTAWTVGGQYEVVVTVGNPCGGTSSTTCYFNYASCKWNGTTAINNVEAISQFNAFPNPFNDKIDFKLTLAKETEITIRLFDITGRLVNEEAPKYYGEGDYLTTINTGSLSAGVYIYNLLADGKTYAGKLVKTQ